LEKPPTQEESSPAGRLGELHRSILRWPPQYIRGFCVCGAQTRLRRSSLHKTSPNLNIQGMNPTAILNHKPSQGEAGTGFHAPKDSGVFIPS
jgi:hypothetical protein